MAAQLLILKDNSKGSFLKDQITSILLHFEEVNEFIPNDVLFSRIKYDRKTERYRDAMTIARMILFNYSPDVTGGDDNTLAILFDMNLLFEEYVYRMLKKVEKNYIPYNLEVLRQVSKGFWKGKTIRPDILLVYKYMGEKRIKILDTKWKILEGSRPSGSDLKQMFVYNIHFGSQDSVLLYPNVNNENIDKTLFELSDAFSNEYKHFCRPYFIDLFDNEGNLKKKELGVSIIEELTEISNKSEVFCY